MDYKRISRIVDSSPFKRGDKVKATTPDGKTREGVVTDFYEYKGKPAISFKSGNESYWTFADQAENLTIQERGAARTSAHADRVRGLLNNVNSEIEEIEEQIQSIYNDPELEEWYTLHPDYVDSGRLPDWMEEQIKELEAKKRRLLARCKGYKKTLGITDSENSVMEFEQNLEAFLDSDDDFRIIRVSEPLDSEDIEGLKKLYQENISEDEFTLHIDDLGGGKYKVSVS